MTFSREQLLRWAFLAFLFSVPLGTKKFLFSFATPFSNYYTSEYTAAFLFGSDLLLVLALALFVFSRPGFGETAREIRESLIFLALLVVCAVLSLFAAPYLPFGIYSLLRLLGALVAGLLSWRVVRSGLVSLVDVLGTLGVSAVFQAIIAILQFSWQKSVGLWWLGETVALGPETPGIAGIVVNGLSFVRAYGTFAHANILAGFLVLGVLALSYLFLAGSRPLVRMGAAGGLAVTLAGLVVTFSRSGWIVGICAFGALLAFALSRGVPWRRIAMLALTAFLSVVILVSALQFAVVPRARLSASESPVRDRWVMNEMGLSLIASRPWGVGLGNQLFYSYDQGMFEEFGLTARGQWQPIHNLYLLLGAETGIVGLAAFLLFLIAVLKGSAPRGDLMRATFVIALLSLLLFGLMDHFLWDLQTGRLMLWMTIGIALGIKGLEDKEKASNSVETAA